MATLKNVRDINLQLTSPRAVFVSTNGIAIALTRTATSVQASNVGVVTVFNDTNTIITVSKGSTNYAYDATGLLPNSFNVTSTTISPVGKVTLGTATGAGNTYTLANITAMDSNTSSATASYTVVVRDTSAISRPPQTVVQTFTKVSAGSIGVASIGVSLSNPAFAIPTDSGGGSAVYTGSGTNIYVYEGNTALNYDGVGTTAGTWKVTSATGVSITPGGITDGGLFAIVAAASALSAATASISFVIDGKIADGTAFSRTITQSFSRAVGGTAGTPGAEGTKSITVSAFQWSNSGLPAYSTAFTYTWSSGAISAYPSGWTSSAPASPGSGYTLYMINLIISATLSATTTATNWSNSTTGAIGYRQDGSIGATGGSGVIAYKLVSGASLPAAPAAPSGASTSGAWSAEYTLWHDRAPTAMATNDWLFQADGTYSTPTYTWFSPTYLATFKVGTLSALSAELGVLQISSGSNLHSSGKAYGTATAGFFLGWDSSAYKFDITHDSTHYFRYDPGVGILFAGDIDTTGKIVGTASYSTGLGYNAAIYGNASVSGSVGVIGNATTGIGVMGFSAGNAGVYGSNTGIGAYNNHGVYGISSGSSAGIAIGNGVHGESSQGNGVFGRTSVTSGSRAGVYGLAAGAGTGVYGTCATSGKGVMGTAADAAGFGVYGQNSTGEAVHGEATSSGTAVKGTSVSGYGVYGSSSSSYGVYGSSSSSYAGYFSGGLGVYISAPLIVTGVTTHSNTIQVTGVTPPSSGSGIELSYYSSKGCISSYNRSTAVALPINLYCSGLEIINVPIFTNLGVRRSPTYRQVTGNGTYTITAATETYFIDFSGITSMTLNMPASPANGQSVEISTYYSITGLTHSGNGSNLSGPLSSSMAAGTGGRWKFMSITGTWFRVDKA